MRKVYLIIAAMMLLCLVPMPYGYFHMVRFLSTLAFGVMAFRYYQERKEWLFCAIGKNGEYLSINGKKNLDAYE